MPAITTRDITFSKRRISKSNPINIYGIGPLRCKTAGNLRRVCSPKNFAQSPNVALNISGGYDILTLNDCTGRLNKLNQALRGIGAFSEGRKSFFNPSPAERISAEKSVKLRMIGMSKVYFPLPLRDIAVRSPDAALYIAVNCGFSCFWRPKQECRFWIVKILLKGVVA